MEHVANRVIGISAVSGGGKTALTRRLAELLQDSVALYFDDYDESSVIPDFRTWFEDGADYEAFKTPVFTVHIRSLKAGNAVTYPGGSKIEPAKNIGRRTAGPGSHRQWEIHRFHGFHRYATRHSDGSQTVA